MNKKVTSLQQSQESQKTLEAEILKLTANYQQSLKNNAAFIAANQSLAKAEEINTKIINENTKIIDEYK